MNARVTAPAPGEAKPVTLAPVEAAKPEADAAPAAAPPAAPVKKKRSARSLALMLAVPVVLAAGGGYFWLTGGRYVETDNAYVQQPKVSISSDVAGPHRVGGGQGQPVGEGGRRAVRHRPRALPDRPGAGRRSACHGARQCRAAARRLCHRQRQARRGQVHAGHPAEGVGPQAALAEQGIGARRRSTTRGWRCSRPSPRFSPEQQVANATAALGGNPEIATDDHPAVRAALAARDNAARNLDKTAVVAPADGIVSQVASLNVGQFIATGSTIATLVETGDTWVEANFKETQLAGLAVGMPVEVKVDAYPGVALRGRGRPRSARRRVREFALIPAQNATGNWVKVTQRVPVHIASTMRQGPAPRRHERRRQVDTKPAGLQAAEANGRMPSAAFAADRSRQEQGSAHRRHHGRDDHAGARHHHRQCRAAPYARQPRRRRTRSPGC